MFGFGKAELAIPISFYDGVLTFRSAEALKLGKSAKIQLQLVVGEAMDTPSVSVVVGSADEGPDGGYVCSGALQLDAKKTRELVAKMTYAGVDGACRRESRRLETTLRILSKQLPGFHAVTKDVSLTGVQLVCDGPVPEGSFLDLAFDLDVVGFPKLTMQALCIHCAEEAAVSARGIRKCRLGVAFTPQHPETHAAWAKFYTLLVGQQRVSHLTKTGARASDMVSRTAMEARANAPAPPPPPAAAPPADASQSPSQPATSAPPAAAAQPSPAPGYPQSYGGQPPAAPYGSASGSGGYPVQSPPPQSGAPYGTASTSGGYPAVAPASTSGGYPAPPQPSAHAASASGGYPTPPAQQVGAGYPPQQPPGYPPQQPAYQPPVQQPVYQQPPAGAFSPPPASPPAFVPPPSFAPTGGGFPGTGASFEALPPPPVPTVTFDHDEPAHAQPVGIDGVNFAFRALDDDGFQVGAVRQVSIDLQHNGQWSNVVLRVNVSRIEPAPSGLCVCWGTLCEDPRTVEVLNQSLASL